jgi:pimeloyl-ACP methyl ester carboxylesterase
MRSDEFSGKVRDASGAVFPGPEAMRLGIAHQDCVRGVVSYIQEQRLKNVVLVGHSFGGSVIQKVAEEIPSLIERTVFLDAADSSSRQCKSPETRMGLRPFASRHVWRD